jgi:hypothetical protein
MSGFAPPEVAGGNGLAVTFMRQQFDEPRLVLDFLVEDARRQVISTRVLAKRQVAVQDDIFFPFGPSAAFAAAIAPEQYRLCRFINSVTFVRWPEPKASTRAVQQEHLAQPWLSQQVRKLEDELGTRLFDRLGRSLRLTSLANHFCPAPRRFCGRVVDA